MSQTILYARVSTTEQTIEHQRTQAESALGLTFDVVLEDHGVSGVSTKLRERKQGRRLFDLLRSGDTLVVRWVDRLGRNYEDVTACIREFIARGVIVRTVINGMTFDGTTNDPMQKAVRDALLGFMAATAQAQAEAMKEAQAAGIQHAKGLGRFRGRKPSFTSKQLADVMSRHALQEPVGSIAKATGLTRQTVYRIIEDPAKAGTQLEAWAEVTARD